MKINKKLRITARIYRTLLSFYKPRIYYPVLLSALILSLIACTKDEDVGNFSSEPAPQPDLEQETIRSESAESPERTVKFTITERASAVQLIAHASQGELRLKRLTAPDGEILFESETEEDFTTSEASEFQISPLTFNYPMLAEERGLAKGEYTALYETRDPTDREFTGAEISLDVISKDDKDFSTGTVNLNIILGGVASNSKDVRDSVDSAMDIVSQMLGRFGISIFTKVISLPEAPELLPNPAEGDIFYEETSKENENGINVFFANDVQGLNAEEYVSAISGASPGPLLPSLRSAIAVSITDATGNDGRFDSSDEDGDTIADSEVRLLAESIAHEVLRYLGLKNSVRFAGNQVVETDGLDSEKCTTRDSCEDNKGANGNLMFPFPLRIDDSSSGEQYYARDRLSTQQVEIAQRYVGLQ